MTHAYCRRPTHCAASRGDRITHACCRMPIHCAASRGDRFTHACICRPAHCAASRDDRITHACCCRPAHCAASRGDREVMSALKSKNADLWKPNHKGERPIHEAAIAKETGQLRIIPASGRCPYKCCTLKNMLVLPMFYLCLSMRNSDC